jgi:hypothetical protein
MAAACNFGLSFWIPQSTQLSEPDNNFGSATIGVISSAALNPRVGLSPRNLAFDHSDDLFSTHDFAGRE